MNKIISLQIIIFISINSNAHAYFDPGTGSFVMQILALAITSIENYIEIFLKKSKNILIKIKKIFSNLFKKIT